MSSSKVTRRTLIGAGAAAGASGLVPRGALAAKAPKTRHADVVGVGAGLSGLQAATDVAAKGKSVIVVEARDRVRRRTLNHKLGGGEIVEIGGRGGRPAPAQPLARARKT